jgi:hypothetical protein
MRQITQNSVNAFLNGETFKSSNTTVHISSDKTILRLHGNLIAVKDKGTEKISITNAGWKSNTTKERLNGLPNVSICQRKGLWYLNGVLWNGDLIEI